MKRNARSVLAGAAALAVAGSGLVGLTGTAFAAAAPWSPDSNSQGTITFYNSAGQVVTGGNSLSNLAAYAVANVTSGTPAGTKATLYFRAPNHATPIGTWFTGAASAATTWPVTSGPSSITSATTPTVTLASSDANLTNFLASATLDSSAGWANLIQVTMKYSGAGGVTQGANYYSTAIAYNTGSSAITVDGVTVQPGEWDVVDAIPALTSTSTAIAQTSGPASPVTSPTSAITLQATVSPAEGGSVQFYDGTTAVGTPQAVTSSNGVASVSTTPATVAPGGTAATHQYTAVFTPTAYSAVASSTSTALSYTVNPTPATATTTSASLSGGSSAYTTQTFSGSVSPAAAGSVSVVVTPTGGGSATTLPATYNSTTGAYSVSTTALGAGSYSYVANFTSSNTALFASSSSTSQSFSLTAPACPGDPNAYPGGNSNGCTDTQTIQTKVTPGYITITTPYTAANPFVLPNAVLNSTGTLLSTSAQFPKAGDAPLTITSTLAGDPNWTATCTSTGLTGTGVTTAAGQVDSIGAANVGLTGWSEVTSAHSNPASTVTFTDNAAAAGVQPGVTPTTGNKGLSGAPVTFATTTGGGNGTIEANGTLTINIPTNTVADTYTGTIIFAVG
jgi:Bacterial Ig-like domain (group 3)